MFSALILKCYNVHEYLCTDVKLGFSPPKKKEKQQLLRKYYDQRQKKKRKEE